MAEESAESPETEINYSEAFDLSQAKEDLSLALLKAIAAQAGFVVYGSARAHDKKGIDAFLMNIGQLPDHGPYAGEEVDETSIKIQLKATHKDLPFQHGYYSFPIDAELYNSFRKEVKSLPLGSKILVVLFLPPKPEDYITCDAEQIIFRKCFRWASLRGAPDLPDGQKSKTVYLPEENLLGPYELQKLVLDLNKNVVPGYKTPYTE